MPPAKSQAKQQNTPGTILAFLGFGVGGAWMLTGRQGAHWLLEHRYFTTESPAFAIPASQQPGAGPTMLTLTATITLIAALVGTTITAWPYFKPAAQKDPDDRRPLPSVIAPLVALCGLTYSAIAFVLIPLTMGLIAGPAALIGTYLVGDWAMDKLRLRRATAQYLNEIEWALLPYLGYKTLPTRRIVTVVKWIEPAPAASDDTEPNTTSPEPQPDSTDSVDKKSPRSIKGRPETILFRYKGRKEELPKELARQIDSVVGGGHYSLAYATTDQQITATATTTEIESAEIVDLREKISATELFGEGAVVYDIDKSPSGAIVKFKVRHKISLKLAGSNRGTIIERKLSEVIPGRWRATDWDNIGGVAAFEIRPELPTFIFPPVRQVARTVAEACAMYPKSEIPLGVDEDENILTWKPSVNPHNLLVGPTGTGKTATIHTSIIGAALLGYRIFIIDFKGGEFTSYRGYPNVVTVVTEPYEAVALVSILYREMMSRYQLYKKDRTALRDKEPFLIVFDEFAEFQQTIKEFYAQTKASGDPKDSPTLKMFGSLMRLARSCRLHCEAATQRPDRQILEGEHKHNFTNRVALGRLDAVSAQMIFDNSMAGRTVPLGVRGRGTTMNPFRNKHTEFQAFYTPDPDDPSNDEEARVLADLRPPVNLYDRGVFQPPETDPATDPKSFAYYQSLKLLKAEEYSQFDPTSDDYDPPAWQHAEDRGVDSIFGSLDPRQATPQSPEELLDAWEDVMSEPRNVPITDLEYGEYFQDPGSGRWGFVDDEILTDTDDPHEQTALIYQRDDQGERVQIRVSFNSTVPVRDIKQLVDVS